MYHSIGLYWLEGDRARETAYNSKASQALHYGSYESSL